MTPVTHRHFDLRHQFRSLRELGIACESFSAYHNTDTNLRISHDVYYASLLMQGSVRHWVDDIEVSEHAGTLTVVAPDHFHVIQTDQPVAVINIYIDPQRHRLPSIDPVLRGALQALLPLHAGLIHKHNRLQRVIIEQPQRLAFWLEQLQHEQSLDDIGSFDAVTALTRLILTDISRAAVSLVTNLPDNDFDPDIERMRQRIDHECCEEQPLTVYSDALHISREHFCRRFHRQVGCPPVIYRRERRLHLAMDALRETDDTIASIAFSCGFQDLAHFNRCFKALTAQTPRAYRHGFRQHIG